MFAGTVAGKEVVDKRFKSVGQEVGVRAFESPLGVADLMSAWRWGAAFHCGAACQCGPLRRSGGAAYRPDCRTGQAPPFPLGHQNVK